MKPDSDKQEENEKERGVVGGGGSLCILRHEYDMLKRERKAMCEGRQQSDRGRRQAPSNGENRGRGKTEPPINMKKSLKASNRKPQRKG